MYHDKHGHCGDHLEIEGQSQNCGMETPFRVHWLILLRQPVRYEIEASFWLATLCCDGVAKEIGLLLDEAWKSDLVLSCFMIQDTTMAFITGS